MLELENLSDEFVKTLQADARITLEKTIKPNIERGRKSALLHGLLLCANMRISAPDWLARAFLRAFSEVWSGNARSWDDVFGPPNNKGEHVAAIRKRRINAPRVWLHVHAATKDGSRAIDEGLFEEIGAKLGLGKTLTAEYYYYFKRLRQRNRGQTAKSHPHLPEMDAAAEDASDVQFAMWMIELAAMGAKVPQDQ